MNLFAVAIFASAFSGMVAGIKATNGSAWSIATFGSVGLVIGIAGYALTMFPAVCNGFNRPTRHHRPKYLQGLEDEGLGLRL
jgi:hypothetical protein